MSVATKFLKLSLAGSAALMAVQPVAADVKDGVNAWSRGQYEKAVKEWREPALAGNSDAQFNLGQAYKLGRGVKVNLNTALAWYTKAAQQGHLQAADSVGHLLHYQGKIASALPYLQASSARGEPRSQYLLATELFNGVHAIKDWVRAYALMTRASSAGMSAASRSLAQMDKYIPLEQRQQGTVLAGQLEQQAGKIRQQQVAGFPIDTTPAAPVGRPVTLPPSRPVQTSSAPGFPSNIPATGRPRTPAPVATQPAIRRVPVTAPTRVATSGNWRIQLGAFGKESNARNLWTRLEGNISELSSLQPYLKAAGSITRLQAGPFATRSAAQAMCGKVKATGQACIVISR
ncbi:MAG: SPOR domain-containing protein [Sphingorhabdus sp.]